MTEKPKQAIFQVLEGKEVGKTVQVLRMPFVIGRSLDCDLCLMDEQVSRRHAQVEKADQGCMILDQGSRNGVFVDGRKIERHLLSHGDTVQVGKTILLYQELAEDIAKREESKKSNQASSFADEPTQIHSINPQILATSSQQLSAVSQATKLFRSSLGLRGTLEQMARILSQFFSPSRLHIYVHSSPSQSVYYVRENGIQSQDFTHPWSKTDLENLSTSTLKAKVLIPEKGKEEVRRMAIAPIMIGSKSIGFFYCERMEAQSDFSNSELQTLDLLGCIAGGALDRLLVLQKNRELERGLQLMEKQLSPEVARRILAKEVRVDEGTMNVEEKEVTVLFSDIKGFTALSERLAPSEIAELLNAYFQKMVDIIESKNGVVNKFIGDAVMALFGAPESHGNDAKNAVEAAVEMLESLKKLRSSLDPRKHFQIRVGINTGNMVVGEIGSEKRMEYTVLGDEVNIASRLEGVADPDGITIGPKTAQYVADHFELELVSGIKVKGKSKQLDVYRVMKKKKG